MKKYFVALILFIVSSSLYSQDYFLTKKLVDNGPDENRLVFVFMGDGYTASEMDKYRADIEEINKRMLTEAPYSTYKSYINVYMIEVISNESGVDEKDNGIYKDTYLNCGFNHDIQRLMTTDATKAKATAVLNVPHYDQAIVIANTSRYGGSGGSVAVSYNGGSAAIMNIHEVGHSIFRLADEYSYGQEDNPLTVEPSERNVTIQTSRSQIKWNKWIKDSTPLPTPKTEEFLTTVGLFEGAKYRKIGVFRPRQGCIMNSMWNNVFCEVCHEAHIRILHEHVTKIKGKSGNVSQLEEGDSHMFSVNLVHPLSHKLTVRWTLNGNFVGTGDYINLDTTGMDPGNYTLKADIHDKTSKVKYETEDFRESTTWNFDLIKKNHPPVIESLTASSGNVNQFDIVTLTAKASDPDGDVLSYNWKTLSGGIAEIANNGSSAKVLVASEGIYEFQLTVSDGKLVDKKTITLTVGTQSETVIKDKGVLSANQADRDSWKTVNLSNNYTDPVIIFSPLSANGADPAVVRVKNVTANSFEWQIEEWDYLGSGSHATEEVGYVVLEAGTYNLSGGKTMIAGNINSSDSFTKIYFDTEFKSDIPVIVTQTVSANDPIVAVARLNNVTYDSFEIRLQSQESLSKKHGDERVSFIAIDPGTYNELGVIKAGSTGETVTEEWYSLDFGTISSKPLFVGAMQTFKGGDTAGLRIKDLTESSVNIKVEEEKSKDEEVNHVKENIGYILFSK